MHGDMHKSELPFEVRKRNTEEKIFKGERQNQANTKYL